MLPVRFECSRSAPLDSQACRGSTCPLAASAGNLAGNCEPDKIRFSMGFTRTQIGIAVGAAALLVFGFLGYIWWLSNQGPVLARSEDHDPLTGLPVSIRMNPLRDRTIEHSANKFLHELRDGRCDQLLSEWEHDYRKKYAHFICDSETQHPLAVGGDEVRRNVLKAVPSAQWSVPVPGFGPDSSSVIKKIDVRKFPRA